MTLLVLLAAPQISDNNGGRAAFLAPSFDFGTEMLVNPLGTGRDLESFDRVPPFTWDFTVVSRLSVSMLTCADSCAATDRNDL